MGFSHVIGFPAIESFDSFVAMTAARVGQMNLVSLTIRHGEFIVALVFRSLTEVVSIEMDFV